MRSRGYGMRGALLVLLSVTLPACGSAGGSLPNAGTSVPPSSTCAQFLPDAPCGEYASASGTENGAALPWLEHGDVIVRLESLEGVLYLTVRTPCGPMSGPVTIDADTMTVDREELALGAMGCLDEEEAAHQKWVLELLRHHPIAMSYSDGYLSWKSGAKTLRLVSQ